MRSTSALLCARPIGSILLVAMLCLTGIARAQTPAPTGGEHWPQRFELNSQEPQSFGFAATQPGTITVDVQAQGAPIHVFLVGPVPQDRVGSGHVVLSYTLTAADIGHGSLWYVRVGLQNPPKAPGSPLAGGVISVQHPAADPAVVQQQANAGLAQHRANATAFQAKLAADTQSKLQARRAELTQQQNSARAAAEARLPPQIQQGRLTTRALPMAQPSQTLQVPARAVALPQQQKAQTAPPPAPAPQVAGVSDQAGRPRQLIAIHGSNFGAQPGAVEFMINAGWKGYGSVYSWSDSLIAVYVPDASGVYDYPAGTVTILRASDTMRSNAYPFGFIAELDTRYITHTNAAQLNEYVIAPPGAMNSSGVDHGPDRTSNMFFAMFSGAKGDDVFFQTARLSDAWHIDWVQVYFDPGATGSGAAWDVSDRVGTNLPFLQVHWYYDAFNYVDFGIQEQITGPRGTADGMVVASAQPPAGVVQ